MLQPVITVHGIWTDGQWQQEIAPVLYPHFEPFSEKYRSYRYLGPLDLVFEPWVLFPGLALWAAAFYMARRFHFHAPFRLAVLLVAVFVLSNLLVHIRLVNTAEKFLNDSAPTVLNGHAHVIAHSLGTYLVARALADDPPTSAERIVLAGCVIGVDFDWNAMKQLHDTKFRALRNEVAGRDLVPIAAWLLRWRHKDFGMAGRKGFRGVAEAVHTVPNPADRCTACPSQPAAADTHNFVSAKKSHSGVLKSTYAKYYWLPFFWEIEPCEFREFLDSCFAMVKAHATAGEISPASSASEFDILAAGFLKKDWEWAGKRTIANYVAAEFNRILTPGEQKIIAFNICQATAGAETALAAKVRKWRDDATARQSYVSAEYDEAIKALYPKTAVKRAFLAFSNFPANR